MHHSSDRATGDPTTHSASASHFPWDGKWKSLRTHKRIRRRVQYFSRRGDSYWIDEVEAIFLHIEGQSQDLAEFFETEEHTDMDRPPSWLSEEILPHSQNQWVEEADIKLLSKRKWEILWVLGEIHGSYQCMPSPWIRYVAIGELLLWWNVILHEADIGDHVRRRLHEQESLGSYGLPKLCIWGFPWMGWAQC